MPSFVRAVLESLAQLSKFPKATPLLLQQKLIRAVSDEIKDHSHSIEPPDQGMLRGFHHVICVALFYVLNLPLLLLEHKLAQACS